MEERHIIGEVRERVSGVRRGLISPSPEMLERSLAELGEASARLGSLVERLGAGQIAEAERPVLRDSLRGLAAEIRLTEALLQGAVEIASGRERVRQETEAPPSYAPDGVETAGISGRARTIYG